MYIKEVNIQGFRSYKEPVHVVFSRGHNVVVGMNGSGKSNLFNAIRFVLGADNFAQMSLKERKELLHEGAGRTVMAASVEIVFGNEDRRVLDAAEVKIRRTIGERKEEYFLNDQATTKEDIRSLLEAAGFSRSNPYYIVQQGRVEELTNMDEGRRLNLLKEVAGARVYDERRQESMKLMGESSKKLEKIQENIQYITKKLADLEDEKEELKVYQELDSERKVLEFSICERDLEESRRKYDDILQKEQESAQDEAAASARSLALITEISEAAEGAKGLEADLKVMRQEKERLESERLSLIRQQAALLIQVQECSDGQSRSQAQATELAAELQHLEVTIGEDMQELKTLDPQLRQIAVQDAELASKTERNERSINALYGKKGRKSRFKSTGERDKWINAQIKELQEAQEKVNQQLVAEEGEFSANASEIETVQRTHGRAQEVFAKEEHHLSQLAQEISETRKHQATVSAARKELWRQEEHLKSERSVAVDDVSTCESSILRTMPKTTSKGLRSVKALSAQHHVAGVHGPILELLTVRDAKYDRAVEIVAGSSIFNVVIDTDDAAAKLINLLQKNDGGRVTFMPLNVLKPAVKELPFDDDAFPLMEVLSFNEQFRPAFTHIFGQTLLCRNLTVAAEYAKKYQVNCITLDGDSANKKGSLTGGFLEENACVRLKNMRRLRESMKKQGEVDAENKKCMTALTEQDGALSRLTGELQKLETKQRQVRDLVELKQSEARSCMEKLRSLQHRQEQLQSSAERLRSSTAATEEQIRGLRAELGTPLQTDLSAADTTLLETLATEMETQMAELRKIREKRMELENRKSLLTTQLESNLLKRRDDIRKKLTSLKLDNVQAVSSAVEEEYESVSQRLTALLSEQKMLDANFSKEQRVLEAKIASMEELKLEENNLARSLQEKAKTGERHVAKKRVLEEEMEASRGRIRELGVLPTDASERFKNVKQDKLYQKLHVVHEKLRKFEHVNKKALDQFISFSDYKKELTDRQTEMLASAESIGKLVDHLDDKKDNAIWRTFKQVAKNFKDVFAELVPDGSGTLVMRRGAPTESESAGASDAPHIQVFTGIGVRIRFEARGQEIEQISLLSGGQKALVALALVFAIQRCDPAPFYLFDEIDSALDPAHRAAVAQIIHRKCAEGGSEGNATQFISVTFKPEMVEQADELYLVRQDPAAKISAVLRLVDEGRVDAKAQALEVIAKAEMDERNEAEMQLRGQR